MASFPAEINVSVNASKALAGVNKVERAIDRLGKNAFLELKIKDNVSGLSSRVSKLKATLNEFNSSSNTAVKIAGKLVDVNARLNDELREQADLLRRAAGVNVTELEASKGRNSIQTRKKQDTFFAQQQKDIDAVQKSLLSLAEAQAEVSNARLNERAQQFVDQENKARQETLRLEQALLELGNRRTTPLQEVLQVERQITNQKTLQAQAERDRQLQGQSTRIPTPYRTAGSMGFPVALPEISQDRKIRARTEARESAARQLNLQKANSLLALGVTELKAQVAIAEQLDGVYDEIVRNLQRANDRQSKLFRARENRQKRQELGGENLQRLQKVNELATNRVLKEQLKNKVMLIGNAIRKNEFTTAKALGKEVDDLLKAEDARIDRARRLLAFRKKERQEARRNAKAAKSRNTAIGRGALEGFGFPLLFGAGPGALLGGGLGGIIGGATGFGFGAQAAGGGIGTIVDNFNKNLTELADSLNSATSILEGLSTAGFRVSKELKTTVETLEEQGDFILAYNIALGELEKRFGPTAVQELKNYDAANEALQEEISKLAAKLQSELLPALTLITQGVAGLLNLINQSGGILRFLAGLVPGAGPGLAAAGTIASSANTGLRRVTGSSTNAFGAQTNAGRAEAAAKEAEARTKVQADLVRQINQNQEKINRAREEAARKEAQHNREILKLTQQRANIEAKRIQDELSLQRAQRAFAIERARARVTAESAGDAAQIQTLEDAIKLIQLNKPVLGTNYSQDNLATLFKNLQNVKFAEIDREVGQLRDKLIQGGVPNAEELAKDFGDVSKQAFTEDLNNRIRNFETVEGQFIKRAKLLNEETKILNTVNEVEQTRLKRIQAQNKAREEVRRAGLDPDSGTGKKFIDATLANFDAANKKVDEFDTKLKTLARDIGSVLASSLETALVDTITAAIQGADDLNEKLQALASNLLTTLGQIVFRAGVGMIGDANQGNILGQLFGTRADGGPVNQNAPYIVGEEGPELFIPGKAGTIVDNDAFNDATNALVDTPQAFSDNEEALTAASAAFAQSAAAMTQATETRSANAAAAAEVSALQTAETYFASGKSTISFDTYRVGEMDVVTREDAIKIGQQSAKQAEANVYKGLRNMPAVRGRSGVK